MKFSIDIIKENGPKIAWLVCGLFIAWVIYGQFILIDEAILRPPLVQENQVTARQSKINQKTLDLIVNNHDIKKAHDGLDMPLRNPFATSAESIKTTTE